METDAPPAVQQQAHIVMDFSSPNMAKPFHAGHLRSTIIGSVLARLYTAAGCRVTRLCYLGDTGPQVGLVLQGFAAYGDQAALQRDGLKHLYDVYVKANKAVEAGDEKMLAGARAVATALEAPTAPADALAPGVGAAAQTPAWRQLWQDFRRESLQACQRVYQRLNVHFDRFDGEAMYTNSLPAVLARLRHIASTAPVSLVTEPNGAVLVDFQLESLGRSVLAKADGCSTYLSRDVAAAWQRLEEVWCLSTRNSTILE